MCGIIGLIEFDKKIVDQTVLKKMTQALSHRGPDDEGLFVTKNIGLGHRRLSIIDISKLGHQPMTFGDYTIVYNGEIYNYLELREELIKKGIKFRTKTDTEVILASYKTWGVNCLQRFNGMWAFILYDKKKDILFIARDRLGVKPLYYWQNKRKMIIASEIKAILQDPDVKKIPNEKIIWDFLVAGWVDHSDQTFFKGINELRGGHYIKLQIKNFKFQIIKYWDLKDKISELPEEKNIKEFNNLFRDSVKLRLRSDVKVGTCLSGGLDSSAIVMALSQELKKHKLSQIGNIQKTFSAVYKKFVLNESPYIKEILKKSKANGYFTFPEGFKLQKEIKKIVWHQDQPFSSTSIYAQWDVFNLAHKKGIKVMLDGQGADELLAGYTGYFGLYFKNLLSEKKFGTLLREFFTFARKHPPYLKNLGEIFIRGIRMGWLGQLPRKFFQKINPYYSVFNKNFLSKYKTPQRISYSSDSFQNALYNSLTMNLSSLLRYEDRNSMAFSIESRVPFLDYRLVEFIFSLPADYKIRNGETKWIMRQALSKLIPSKILNRQDKIGFATPEEKWLKKDLRAELTTCFSSESFRKRDYWDSQNVLNLYKKFISGQFKDSQLFWRLYCLEIWFRVFID